MKKQFYIFSYIKNGRKFYEDDEGNLIVFIGGNQDSKYSYCDYDHKGDIGSNLGIDRRLYYFRKISERELLIIRRNHER